VYFRVPLTYSRCTCRVQHISEPPVSKLDISHQCSISDRLHANFDRAYCKFQTYCYFNPEAHFSLTLAFDRFQFIFRTSLFQFQQSTSISASVSPVYFDLNPPRGALHEVAGPYGDGTSIGACTRRKTGGPQIESSAKKIRRART